MLQNAYFLAKIGADTAENEQHFAEILPIGRRVADRLRPRGRSRPARTKENIKMNSHFPCENENSFLIFLDALRLANQLQVDSGVPAEAAVPAVQQGQ